MTEESKHIFVHLVALKDGLLDQPDERQKHVEAVIGYLWDDELDNYWATLDGDPSDEAVIEHARKEAQA